MSGRSATKRWFKTQSTDPFVKQREQRGYRSRAAFKLQEIIARDRILKRGDRVLDLGASPGGWTQVAVACVGAAGRVVAVDILPMEPLAGATFILGDCREETIQLQIRAALGESTIDLVLSDMAPNLTGIRSVDQARSLELAEDALATARNFLRPGGTMLIKLFQHAETDRFIRALRESFTQVARRKPAASRSKSSEFYTLAQGYKL